MLPGVLAPPLAAWLCPCIGCGSKPRGKAQSASPKAAKSAGQAGRPPKPPGPRDERVGAAPTLIRQFRKSWGGLTAQRPTAQKGRLRGLAEAVVAKTKSAKNPPAPTAYAFVPPTARRKPKSHECPGDDRLHSKAGSESSFRVGVAPSIRVITPGRWGFWIKNAARRNDCPGHAQNPAPMPR